MLKIGALSGGSGDVGSDLAYSRMLTEVPGSCKQAAFFSFKIMLLNIKCVHIQLLQSCLTLCDPVWTYAHQASLYMGFSRQEYWSGLPCPPPEDLLNSGIELVYPALQMDSLPLSHCRSPNIKYFMELVMDTEAWRPAGHGVPKSQTRLSN